MAFEDRSYSGNAIPTTLTASITNLTTTIPIASSTGWPDGTSGPFHIGIAPAGSDAYTEVIRCTGRTGLNLNVQTVPVNGRGWDNTTASSHAVNSVVHLVFTATDADEANQHYSNTGLDHHAQYLNVIRHDSSARHGIGILPTGGTASTSSVGDTAQAGTSGTLSLSDHRHARESFGSPVTAGPVNANGTAVTLPRSDHKHAGGIPILTFGTRPSSPVTGETILESDTFRMTQWTGSRWQRGAAFSQNGRTGAYVIRNANFSVPDGGAGSHIIPWDTEIQDTDGFIPAPDGTTTKTLTVPSIECGGFYIAFAHFIWASIITARAYVEVYHSDGVGIFQYRVSTTGEDRGAVAAMVPIFNGHTIQVGVWQNSGAAVNITGLLYLYRLFA